MTTTPDARKRLAEKHADRTAPTPAPVAVPEEAVEVAARAYATLIGASEEEPVYNADRKIVQEVIEAALPHLAPRENARPEPVAAPLPTEAERLRDLVSRLGFGDGVTEPMADNDAIVKYIEERFREADEWQDSQSWRTDCHLAGHPDDEDCAEHDPAMRLMLAESEVKRLRSLVPADDEDAVRVPRRTVARLANAFNDAGGYQQVDPPLAVAISEVTAVLR